MNRQASEPSVDEAERRQASACRLPLRASRRKDSYDSAGTRQRQKQAVIATAAVLCDSEVITTIRPSQAMLLVGGERDVVDISLILPTRRRVSQLTRALDSLAATAADPRSLEVVLYVDSDDAESLAVEFAALRVTKLVGNRGNMGAITRTCYQSCRGRYLMLANDDIVFRTPGWDAEVLARFRAFGDDVGMVWGNDLCSGAPTHPFISRTACELMGGICPAAYYREYIDTHLHDVFRRLARHGHGRAVYLPCVVIEHLHPIAGKAAADEVYANRWRQRDELAYIERRDERAHQAALLARYITARRAAQSPATSSACRSVA